MHAFGQLPQCRFQGTAVSVIIVFVLNFFVFVLVFVNENHTEYYIMPYDMIVTVDYCDVTSPYVHHYFLELTSYFFKIRP